MWCSRSVTGTFFFFRTINSHRNVPHIVILRYLSDYEKQYAPFSGTTVDELTQQTVLYVVSRVLGGKIRVVSKGMWPLRSRYLNFCDSDFWDMLNDILQ